MSDEKDDAKTTTGGTTPDFGRTEVDAGATRVEPTPTPPPTSSSQSSRSSDPSLSIAPDNLLEDRLLTSMPRTDLNGRSVPCIGGIPLLSKLGQGGMGAVYLGYKTRLRQLVAVKVLPLHLAQLQPDMVARFLREAQIAASIESPHLVRVSDVDEEEGLSYFVMEYVTGVSAGSYLKQLVRSGQQGLPEAEALDICIAATTGLAVAHEAGVVHRDVKPDNILIPRMREGDGLRFRDSKISDLGLARSEELGQTITGSQSGMGTPGYMAPEQAMSAKTAGKAADVFSMGATLYALLGGRSPFAGDSSTAVIMATIQQPHAPIRDKRPDVSEATGKLIDLCLEKGPERRFKDASALVEALQLCRDALSGNQTVAETTRVLTELQLTEERGEKTRTSSPTLRELPGEQPATMLQASSPGGRRSRGPLLAAITALIAIAILAIIFIPRLRRASSAAVVADPASAEVHLPIAYSGEKERWLPWAVKEFSKTADGKNVTVDLLPMSQTQAEDALMKGNPKIVVWTPTSGILRQQFEDKWRTKHNSSPIASDQLLTLTPQVFVMYKSRYDELRKKLGELRFASLHKALEAGSWQKIGGNPKWGLFTFAISDPAQYNNGLTALCLMAAERSNRDDALTVADVSSPEFRQWIHGFDRAFHVSGNSTQAMTDFVLKGPSEYDGVFTYESTALTFVDDAADRWEDVVILYPAINIWNDSRYYVLNAPWITESQKKAAADFGDFLLSDEVQQQLVLFGFRPGKPDVRLRSADSPFMKEQSKGLHFNIPVAIQPPSPEVIQALTDLARPAK